MISGKIQKELQERLHSLDSQGILKGREQVITAVRPPRQGFGPRCCLAGHGDREFLKMNSNSYLGLSLDAAVIRAEEKATARYGAGPGAVRFISGTYAPHVELERRLAAFHGREAAMIFSAAYAAVMGVLPQFITRETLVVSDQLNHNCIINAVRLAKPAEKMIYSHLDMADLEAKLKAGAGKYKRALVVTDGVFSMRGDYAPLDRLVAHCAELQDGYEEGIITVADDSHGIGALGKTGRGTEEYTGAQVDILVATLGKALGVNGGYVVARQTVIDYLRETAPFYIYSNPITPSEAAAASQALAILDSDKGRQLLDHVRQLTGHFEQGVQQLGYETIPGEHPIVPLMVRDTQKTAALVAHLFEKGILATGLNYPVVPKGDQEIRFQIAASHTKKDIDSVLAALAEFEAGS